MVWDGFLIGALFGAALFLAGLANPDKLVGTLRLVDFHAMRVIAVFVLVGMVGVTILGSLDAAHLSVKPAAIVSVLLGGGLLGLGMGITGYCPGTGLACAAAGRLDALVSVFGMLLGAGAYIAFGAAMQPQIDGLWDLGKETLPGVTGTSPWLWTLLFAVPGAVALWLTRPGRPPAAPKRDAAAPAGTAAAH